MPTQILGHSPADALEDPGTAGDEGEENWADLLREWLPHGYHVRTKGRILSELGGPSPQVDVLVLSPAYPPRLLNRKRYLASGVVAAFECKLTLRPQHIAAAVKNAAVIRRTLYVVAVAQRGVLSGGLGTIGGMPMNFLACDREQVFLMPPNVRDWLPEDHLVWFVLASVEEMDLSPFYVSYRPDGHGRAAHDPAVMA